MKSIVIGANGFLGSSLVEKLIHENHEVIAVFNKNRDKIDEHVQAVSFSELESINSNDVDFVFYLSGSFSSTHTDLININCTSLNSVSLHFSEAKLIYISSTNVYGDYVDIINEKSPYNNPNIYGLSKIAGEFICQNHKRFAILRLCYLYGPDLNNNSFLPKMIKQARIDKKIVLYGAGEREQDYLYVSDAVDLCHKAAVCAENGGFLGATGNSYSNQFIAHLIKKEDQEIAIEYVGTETGKSLYFDPQESFRKLDWSPKITMEAGIKNMWNASTDLW